MAYRRRTGLVVAARKILGAARPGGEVVDVGIPDPRFLLSDPMVRGPLERADRLLDETRPSDRPALFKDTSSEAFALLAAGDYDGLPNLRAWLPTMPSTQRQEGSVGTSGAWTMIQAAAFVRAVVTLYKSEGRDLAQARVLDYGICWARLSRLFYQSVPVDQLFGVDAWNDSLDQAREVGYRGRLSLIDAVPEALPFSETFDLVVAFSIFTHLSPTSANAAVRAIRSGMASGGLFALTLRPAAYWKLLGRAGPDHRDQLGRNGFAFTPDAWALKAGNLHYGNATISIDYVRANWPGFEVAGVEILPIDPYQIGVVLRAT